MPIKVTQKHCEKPNFIDFLKVYNELGKVTKFGTSRPLFSWRNGWLIKGRADPDKNIKNIAGIWECLSS